MLYNMCKNTIFLLCSKEKHEKANNTGYKKTCLLHYEMLISYHYAVYDLVLSANAKPSLFTPKTTKPKPVIRNIA